MNDIFLFMYSTIFILLKKTLLEMIRDDNFNKQNKYKFINALRPFVNQFALSDGTKNYNVFYRVK